jgi:uncharacterized protein (TIGR02145 family)
MDSLLSGIMEKLLLTSTGKVLRTAAGKILRFSQPDFTPIKYGLLYNWYAATDARNIAGVGWGVPTLAEYVITIDYLGGTLNAQPKLKEVGTKFWMSSNGTNLSGFSARAAGRRNMSGNMSQNMFYGMTGFTAFWTSTLTGDYPYYVYIYESNVAIEYNFNYKQYGWSIRLLKSTTTLTHGQTGTYTGNDGKVYPTICIGNQEWLAANLMETKYRDGSTIPNVTDNSAWAALTTGACCAYNNDQNNV